MNKCKFEFRTLLWPTLSVGIISRGGLSLWYKFFSALFRFVFLDWQNKLNDLFSQFFAKTQNYNTLVRRAADMKIYPKISETKQEFQKRYNRELILRNHDLNKNAIKAIFSLYLGVDSEIIESSRDDSFFQIGVTPIGSGGIFASDFFRFAWTVFLPDLKGKIYNKSEIVKMLNEFSCSCEFFVYERRGNKFHKWNIN